ncbi:thioredoxin-like protein [Coccomyxa subellipsoidea C-169]|uniref:Thioredoxin-like protein n=1 Tax=Coccomyxa subellipsoidea (strain C-169) TaxID=574566 RepID=I0YMT2_COCSC|nr:thioredoxin-like protein [Coccomyxa subellipsoidea C-169]EIE19701.1 thioredoxin-like protein [Coccomyxa subellipsoidea C-169]|eukprot:XP_005644245.1 thioredoxin-like protein [Coccomyxa subellipsoidea C-169]
MYSFHELSVNAAKNVEDQIDNRLQALENLDADDIEKLRQRRLHQMKLAAAQKQEWSKRGHGEYREIFGEKEFFSEMKGEERMVCHFFRENWPCKVMDKHLQLLAQRHLETKFVKIHAEKSPFLVEKLKVWMLPTLALIKREKTVDYVVGFGDLGGKDDFSTEMLAARLAAHGLINEPDSSYGHRAAAGPKRNLRHGGGQRGGDSDEDSDFD